jgi:hypothetical protein
MRRLLLALCLCLVTLLALQPSAAGQAPQRRNPELGLNAQPIVTDAHVRMLGELGVSKIRLSVWWGWWEGEQERKWAEMRPRLRRAGIEVLPVITAPPGRLNRQDWRVLAREVADFTDRFLDRHGPYPYVQIGNEWDSGSPWFGPESGVSEVERGRRYGRFLQVVARRLRAEHPGTRIVTGGIVHTNDFVRGLYETGVGAFDVVAIHTYGDHVWGEPWSRGANVKRTQARHGRSEPVWVTEFGMGGTWQGGIWRRERRRWPARQELDQYHLDNWRIPLDEDESRFLYERVYGFQLPPGDDNQTLREAGLNPLDYGFGLLRSDNRTPRPTYEWLRRRQYNASR